MKFIRKRWKFIEKSQKILFEIKKWLQSSVHFFQKIIKSEIHIKSQIYGIHTHYLMIDDIKMLSSKFTTPFRADICFQWNEIWIDCISWTTPYQSVKKCSMNPKSLILYIILKSHFEQSISIFLRFIQFINEIKYHIISTFIY